MERAFNSQTGSLKSAMSNNTFKVLFQNTDEFKIPSKLEKSFLNFFNILNFSFFKNFLHQILHSIFANFSDNLGVSSTYRKIEKD